MTEAKQIEEEEEEQTQTEEEEQTHGVWNREQEARGEINLLKSKSLQTDTTNIKHRLRLVNQHCTEADDERYIGASLSRPGQPAPLAVCNKHTMIKGNADGR